MTLQVQGLTTTYSNGVQALRNVSLRIPPGLFGLLGPNGAGKSTLMRTLATLQRPDAGSIRFGEIDGLADPAALRAVLGYLPQDFGLYPAMSAEATLDHFAVLKGVLDAAERRDRVRALLTQVNLDLQRTRAVGGFSGGMRQRLGIAIALIGRPQLLIVDEPTSGLDPVERHRFLNLLASVGDEVVVILSTHLVEDVRDLCARMAMLDQGCVVLEGRPDDLLHLLRDRVWRARLTRPEAQTLLPQLAAGGHRVLRERVAGRDTVLYVEATTEPAEGFTRVDPTLEDVYLSRVSAARDDAA
jgi:ABC-type multidrug transport system ATPase subunit